MRIRLKSDPTVVVDVVDDGGYFYRTAGHLPGHWQYYDKDHWEPIIQQTMEGEYRDITTLCRFQNGEILYDGRSIANNPRIRLRTVQARVRTLSDPFLERGPLRDVITVEYAAGPCACHS